MHALGEQNNLRFNGTSMSYRIGDYNKNLFIAGNTQTVGTFPGFKLNNQYRVYINYFNAANVQLNQAGGQVEMSLHASPMTKASPPQVRPHKVLVMSSFLFVCRRLQKFYNKFYVILGTKIVSQLWAESGEACKLRPWQSCLRIVTECVYFCRQ